MKKWFFLLMAIVLILTENGKVSASIEGEAIDIANETVLTTEEKDKIVEAIMNLLDASTSVRKRGEIKNVSLQVMTDIMNKETLFEQMERGIGGNFDKVYHCADIYEANYTRDGLLDISLYDMTIVWYHYGEGSESTDYFSYGTWHDILLEKNEESWVILKDSFDERAVTGAVSYDIILAEQEKTEQEISENITPSIPTRYISFSYTSSSLNTALQYAIQYCGLSAAQRLSLGYVEWRGDGSSWHNNVNYNLNYHDFVSEGGDCCNFVSQILYAAGVPVDTVWFYDPDNPYSSNAWKGVIAFVNCYADSYSDQSIIIGNYSNVYPGNPIYWTNNPQNHIMFCVGYNSAGVPVICCHTNDAYRVPITNSNYVNKGLKTLLIATSNLHSHTQAWRYNNTYHYRVCNYCEYHFYHGVHQPNLMGNCIDCGAHGPFAAPLE